MGPARCAGRVWATPGSAGHNFFAPIRDASCGVAGVDYQGGVVDDALVVVARVICGDEYAIVAGNPSRAQRDRVLVGEVVVAHFVELREVRVVVIDHGAAFGKQFEELERGRFTEVVDVFLVSYAEEQDFRAFNAFLTLVKRCTDGVDYVIGHFGVDFAGQLDEAGREIVFPGFPRQIVRIDRNAVAPETGPGIERHEAEGFCGGAVDDLPDVEAHAQAELLELVNHGDVHAAENVLHELDHFGCARGGDRNDFRHDLRVEAGCGAAARWVNAADDFWNLREAELFVAGIFAFGREG